VFKVVAHGGYGVGIKQKGLCMINSAPNMGYSIAGLLVGATRWENV